MRGGGWYTYLDKTMHGRTGARNMREHREAKRRDAEYRNAQTAEHLRSGRAAYKAASDAMATAPSKEKLSRQRRFKVTGRLAATQRATREWLDKTGPGVDF